MTAELSTTRHTEKLDPVAKVSSVSEVPWPKPNYAWYVVAMLVFANMLSYLDRILMSVLVGPIRAALGISDFEISLLLGLAFAIFFSLFGLPLGWLADRLHRRNLVAAGVAIWSAMTAACGLATSFAGLFLARLGVGAGEATLAPAAYSMLGDYFPRHRLSRAIAVYSLGIPLGSGVALLGGALFISAIENAGPITLPLLGTLDAWRLAFLAPGVVGLALALAFFTVREPPRRKSGVAETDAETLRAFLSRNKIAVATHLVATSLIIMVLYGMGAWAPTFFARTYAMTAAHGGAIFGVIVAITGALGLIAYGWLTDWRLTRGVHDASFRGLRFAALAGAPVLAAAWLMPSPLLAFVLLAIAMTLLSVFGLVGGALQLISPPHLRAQLAAMQIFSANVIGLGLGPSAVAALTDFVFADDNAIRYSLLTITLLALPCAAIILSLGMGAYGRAVAAAGREV